MKRYFYDIDLARDDAAAKVLGAVGTGKRVLEAGCASGVQTRVMKEQLGCSVTGIEVDPAAAAEARQYCDQVYVADLETFDFAQALQGHCFDVILFADVLEHLKCPEEVLKKAKHCLRDTGFVAASIPNVAHAAVALELVKGKFEYRPWGLLDDTHIRFFTKKSILQLFQDSGLTVIALDRVQRGPETTEFYCAPYTEDERSLLSDISKTNVEWDTYQFIVKAVPHGRPGSDDAHAAVMTADTLRQRLRETESANAALSKRNRELEREIAWTERFRQMECANAAMESANAALSRRNRELESQITWIEGRPLYRALQRVRRVFKARLLG